MSENTRAARIAQTLRERSDLLERVAAGWVLPGLEDEDLYELAEEICVVTFGPRVECPSCGSNVFPGFLCWGCGEWTAPEGREEKP